PGELQALDRWLLERTEQLVAEMTEAYERYWTPSLIRAFDSFVDDLSNWYIRRSRRRFWNGDEVALWTLWQALVRSAQVVAPVMCASSRTFPCSGRSSARSSAACGPHSRPATSSSSPVGECA